jgi:Flp pilus assembly protein TadD
MSTLDPVDALRQADELLRRRRPGDALAVLAPLLSDEPNSRAVLELAGRAWFSSAQLGRAETAFARLVELDPTDAYARFALGRVYERQSRHGEARRHFRLAVAMDPRAEYSDGLARVEQRLA